MTLTKPNSMGIDVGGTKIASGVLQDKNLLHFQSSPTPTSGAEAVLDEITKHIRQQLEHHPDVKKIGVALPGPLDQTRHILQFAANIPDFNNVKVVDHLKNRLNLTVSLENDAKAAALAEALLGAGQNSQSCVYITVSTGIGAGIVLHGQLWRGKNGIAGEIGHTCLLPSGPIDGLGNAGALEALASGSAIAKNASYALRKQVSAAETFALAQAGHPLAQKVIDQALSHLGQAIANLQKTLDPELFVIGGGVARAGEAFFKPLRSFANQYAQGFASVNIQPAKLGEHTGVIGACLTACNA